MGFSYQNQSPRLGCGSVTVLAKHVRGDLGSTPSTGRKKKKVHVSAGVGQGTYSGKLFFRRQRQKNPEIERQQPGLHREACLKTKSNREPVQEELGPSGPGDPTCSCLTVSHPPLQHRHGAFTYIISLDRAATVPSRKVQGNPKWGTEENHLNGFCLFCCFEFPR